MYVPEPHEMFSHEIEVVLLQKWPIPLGFTFLIYLFIHIYLHLNLVTLIQSDLQKKMTHTKAFF